MLSNLPGKEAQLILAPTKRVESLLKEMHPPENAKQSAVLVLLYPTNNGNTIEELYDWELLVILRNTYDGVHSGQVAFPGGKCEKQDCSHEATAAREAFEEMGIDVKSYSILGEMTHIYVPPSNFTIYPILAISKSDHDYKIEYREVIEHTRIPLRLFDPKNIQITKVQRTKNDWSDAPCYIIGKYIIWGATAMIISELYQFIPEAKVLISRSKP